ncbi:MAG: GntR family transcriptional regulator, partial [Desulfobacterales bacterium]|nr:GntR family transcriptional regulator [Desulfobacterales bacterium]
KPRRGVFVARINARDAWEIYTLKAELYDFSITLSFHQLTEDHLNRMERLVERMEACVRADAPDILSYLEMNGRFHAVHVDAAGHERLKQILGMLHKQIRCFSYQTHSVREHLERSHRYHRDIYNAFKAGDQALAARLTRDHVLAGLKEFQDAPGGKAGRGRGGKDGD